MSTYNAPFDFEKVKAAAKESLSWRDLALRLGLTFPSSVVYRRLRPFCSERGIDCSHFLGQKAASRKNRGVLRQDIQVYTSNEQPINSHSLKIRLIKEGLKQHRCEQCKRTEWNGKIIPIQLHHLDGNSANNEIDNLQILCPNCHAQTENYCAKNRKRTKRQSNPVSDEALARLIPLSRNPSQTLRELGLSLAQAHYRRINRLMAADPTLQFLARSTTRIRRNPNADPYWRIKPKPNLRKVVRPSKEELEKLVWTKPMSQLGKDYGVSDKGIRKWCEAYGVTNIPPARYWPRRRAGWTHEEALVQIQPKQPAKRLTDQQVQEILTLLGEKRLGVRDIGRQYNICHQTIAKIRDGQAYQHISRMVPPAELESASKD